MLVTTIRSLLILLLPPIASALAQNPKASSAASSTTTASATPTSTSPNPAETTVVSNSHGVIAGAAVSGALAGVLLFVAGVWIFWHRRQRKKRRAFEQMRIERDEAVDANHNAGIGVEHGQGLDDHPKMHEIGAGVGGRGKGDGAAEMEGTKALGPRTGTFELGGDHALEMDGLRAGSKGGRAGAAEMEAKRVSRTATVRYELSGW